MGKFTTHMNRCSHHQLNLTKKSCSKQEGWINLRKKKGVKWGNEIGIKNGRIKNEGGGKKIKREEGRLITRGRGGERNGAVSVWIISYIPPFNNTHTHTHNAFACLLICSSSHGHFFSSLGHLFSSFHLPSQSHLSPSLSTYLFSLKFNKTLIDSPLTSLLHNTHRCVTVHCFFTTSRGN